MPENTMALSLEEKHYTTFPAPFEAVTSAKMMLQCPRNDQKDPSTESVTSMSLRKRASSVYNHDNKISSLSRATSLNQDVKTRELNDVADTDDTTSDENNIDGADTPMMRADDLVGTLGAIATHVPDSSLRTNLDPEKLMDDIQAFILITSPTKAMSDEVRSSQTLLLCFIWLINN